MLEEISKIEDYCLRYVGIAKEKFDDVSDDIPANIFMYIVKIAGEIVGMFNLYDRDSARKLEFGDAEDFKKVKDAAAVSIVNNVKIECCIDLMFVDVERMLSCLCDNVYVSFVKRIEENNKYSLSDNSTRGDHIFNYKIIAVMKDGSSQMLDNPEFSCEGLHSIVDAEHAAHDAIEHIGAERVDRIDIYDDGEFVKSVSTPRESDSLDSDSIVFD